MATTPVMKIVPPYTPELLPEVRHRVEDFLLGRAPDRRKVLEYGSGWSTVWFVLMGCRIFSFEDDPGWADEVAHATRRIGDIHVPYNLTTVKELVGIKVDLMYIDCTDDLRPALIESSPRKIDAGGAILIDDSHWDLVRPSIERVLTQGFEREWTVGGMHVRKTGERKYHESTLLRKI